MTEVAVMAMAVTAVAKMVATALMAAHVAGRVEAVPVARIYRKWRGSALS